MAQHFLLRHARCHSRRSTLKARTQLIGGSAPFVGLRREALRSAHAVVGSRLMSCLGIAASNAGRAITSSVSRAARFSRHANCHSSTYWVRLHLSSMLQRVCRLSSSRDALACPIKRPSFWPIRSERRSHARHKVSGSMGLWRSTERILAAMFAPPTREPIASIGASRLIGKMRAAESLP